MLAGRHWLFVAEFSPRMVEEFLRRRIGEIEGATWSEAAQQVRRLGSLGSREFEDHGPGSRICAHWLGRLRPRRAMERDGGADVRSSKVSVTDTPGWSSGC